MRGGEDLPGERGALGGPGQDQRTEQGTQADDAVLVVTGQETGEVGHPLGVDATGLAPPVLARDVGGERGDRAAARRGAAVLDGEVVVDRACWAAARCPSCRSRPALQRWASSAKAWAVASSTSASAYRDHFVLATKFTLGAAPQPNISKTGNSRKNMVASVEAGMKRLGTDYIDLLGVHFPDKLTPMEELLRGLDDLASAGKIHHAALSNFPARRVSRAATLADLKNWAPIVGIQHEYSLVERTADRELLPMAESLGLVAALWSPLGVGLLTGKYRSSAEGRLSDLGAVIHTESIGQKTAVVDTALAIAQETGATPAPGGGGPGPRARRPLHGHAGPDHRPAQSPPARQLPRSPRCPADRRAVRATRQGQRRAARRTARGHRGLAKTPPGRRREQHHHPGRAGGLSPETRPTQSSPRRHWPLPCRRGARGLEEHHKPSRAERNPSRTEHLSRLDGRPHERR